MMFYILVSLFILNICNAEVFHHSTTGEYHVVFREFGACPPEKRGTNEFFSDVRLSRKHRTTELIGKYMLLVPFDDTFSVDVNFAILSSNAAWLPNAYSLPIHKACTTMVNLLGESWKNFLRSMNMSTKCPIPKGVYEQKGYDVENFLRNTALPTQVIFGKYKVSVEYIRKKQVLGCTYFVMDVIPLWQWKKKQSRT